MMQRSTYPSLTGALALLAGLAGCGNLTAGGFGEAVVVVSADVTSTITSIQAPLPAFVSGGGDPGGSIERHDGHDHPEGQLEVDFMAYLVSASGVSVPLSDDDVEVRVDLEGVEQDETDPVTIPADEYDQLRLVFLKIEAEVDAGLIINGEEVLGPVEVDFEGSLEVFKPIDLTVTDSGRAEILIGLNAASWLQAVDPATGIVDATVFANLVEISTR